MRIKGKRNRWTDKQADRKKDSFRIKIPFSFNKSSKINQDELLHLPLQNEVEKILEEKINPSTMRQVTIAS